MEQQYIFGDRNYKNKLANFNIDSILNTEEKKRLIETYIKSLNSGKIEQTKEEAIQADFLNIFFGDVLDYDYKNSNSWNLEKEYKSVTDATKADGALGFFGMEGRTKIADVRAVIELKDSTTDLDKSQNRLGDKRTPVEQAFSYASKAGGQCKWVIVSNFKELRLYHASDQSRYELFQLQELLKADSLKRFFFLLHKDRLISRKGESIVDLLYRERMEFEQSISEQFYNRYKSMRIELFNHLKQFNPGKEPLLLLTKTQKLLDRFVFVCFCEDSNLIPPYTLKKIKDILSTAFDFEPDKIWRQLKGLFHSIDRGNTPLGINKFNGGLFSKDEELDSLIIKDNILLDLIDFSNFDFDSDLNVNILGHIFEKSLSDIEEIKVKENNGKQLSHDEKTEIKKNGKRKKEGIFYTPEYITRYIVKEAIGSWLEDRKRELGFYDLPQLTPEDFDSIKIVKRKSKKDGKLYPVLEFNHSVERHLSTWEAYKEKLQNIKVLDPACGSGAFLNQVFDFLYMEGQRVNDEISRLKLGQRDIFELDRHILTNNIYGVDLNTESVEISKLSLWLKTAKKDKELTALDENIKCGNSLIDDPSIAGDRAFAWKKEYSEIMQNGGFDIIIGNPPYVFAREKISDLEKSYFVKNFSTAEYQINTYILFIERSANLLKDHGYLGLIVPNAWLMVSSAQKMREMLLEDFKISEIANLIGFSFQGVNVETIILNAKKEKCDRNRFNVKLSSGHDFIFSHTRDQEEFFKNEGMEFRVFSDDNSDEIYKKLIDNTINLEEIALVKAGLQAYESGKGIPVQTSADVKKRPYDFNFKYDENTYPYLDGKDVNRYYIKWDGNYLKYGEHLAAPRTFDIFSNKKIIVREITGKYPKSIIATYSEEIYLFNRSNIAVLEKKDSKTSLKYILGLLNSKLLSYYFLKFTPKAVRQMFPKIILQDLRRFPIRIAENQHQIVEKVELMLSENKKFINLIENFVQLIKFKCPQIKINTRISEWYDLSFDELLEEFNKQKIKLSLHEQSEWLTYFAEQKQKSEFIHLLLSKTDKEIDRMVYEIYELTEEEISIIESTEVH